MELKKLNLSIYNCKKLKEISRNIEIQWGENNKKINNFELIYILKNIIKKDILNSGDILKIFSSLGQVKFLLKEKYDMKIESFFEKLELLLEQDSSLKEPLNLDIFYDSNLVFYKNEDIQDIIFNIVNEIIKLNRKNNLIMSKKTRYFIEMIDKKEYIIKYLTEKLIKGIDKYLDDLFEFELEYYINRNSELFFDIIENIIESYIGLIVSDKNYKTNEIINKNFKLRVLEFKKKVEIYKKILNTYERLKSFNQNTNIWFKEISEDLGDITDKNNNKWKEFSESQKAIFSRWFFMKEINKFFGEKVKDPTRTEFWKKYAHCLKNIIYRESFQQAIIMEFENHTIVEFGKKGNAAYVYPKISLNINTIKNYSMFSATSATSAIFWLKNSPNPIYLKEMNYSAGWNHASNWQAVFKYRLAELGYKTEGRIW